MDATKVRVKFGILEVDYEGDGAFVRDGLLDLITDVVKLSKLVPAAPSAVIPREPSSRVDQPRASAGTGDLTISTIAAHLQPDGPQELILCAFAKLQIVDGMPKVERTEIGREMKQATAYYKSSMGSNYPRDLGRMVKAKKINELSSGVYSLTAASKLELESKIAGIE